MYNEDDNNRRNELISLRNLSANLGMYLALHSDLVKYEQDGRTMDEFILKTREDEQTFDFLVNKVNLGITRKQMSEAEDIAGILLLEDGRWAHFQIGGMIDGFRNSYRPLIEDKMMIDERDLEDLFLGEAVNYSAELDRYAEKWADYNLMNWGDKPMKRSELG